MTHREREMLRFIERYIADHDGVAPTLAEMSSAIGCASKSSAHRIVTSLERQGKIERTPGYVRTWRIVRPTVDLAGLDDAAILTEAARRGLVKAAA